MSKELRTIALDYDDMGASPKDAIRVSVDLKLLIERVYVAPMQPAWVSEITQAVVQRCEMSPSIVTRPPLSDPPDVQA